MSNTMAMEFDNTYIDSFGLKKYLKNPLHTLNRHFKQANTDFVKSIVVENFLKKELNKNCLLYTKDYWSICNVKGKQTNYIIHICNEIDSFAKEFEKEFPKNLYHVIHIIINKLTLESYFVVDGQTYYDIDFLTKKLGLSKKNKETNTKSKNDNNDIKVDKTKIIDPELGDWFKSNNDIYTYLSEKIIAAYLNDNFFDYCVNFDSIWMNNINGENFFVIGEIKMKSKNEEQEFWINKGEKYTYEKILKSTNIKVAFLALLSNKHSKEFVFKKLLKNEVVPLFYYLVDFEELSKINTYSNGNVSTFSKENGACNSPVAKISYSKFKRAMDFSFIGKSFSFNERVGEYWNRNFYNFNESENILDIEEKNKIKSIQIALYKLVEEGADFDLIAAIKSIEQNNIVTINNKRCLVKFMEHKLRSDGQALRSWAIDFPLTQHNRFLDCNSFEKIDYIIALQHSEPIDKNNFGSDTDTFVSLIKNSKQDFVLCYGFVSTEDYFKKRLLFPKNHSMTQKNRNAVISNRLKDLEVGNFPTKEDFYFIPVIKNTNLALTNELTPFVMGKHTPIFESLISI